MLTRQSQSVALPCCDLDDLLLLQSSHKLRGSLSLSDSVAKSRPDTPSTCKAKEPFEASRPAPGVDLALVSDCDCELEATRYIDYIGKIWDYYRTAL